MAVGLYCPECGEYFGKDIECYLVQSCGNCGITFYNERGDTDDLDREDMDWLLHNKPKVYRRLMKTTFQNFN